MIKCHHCGADNADEARFCGACGRATSSTEPTGGARAQQPAPDLVGREILGRYRVLAKLGEGGMGAVYRGEQISLKRKVAIKLLHPELSSDPGLLRRFNAEAEAVAKLGHPNTINIYDFGQDSDGTLFIAMEYLEGKSLRQELAAGGPMPPRRALHIATQIASSIVDAHAHGIVHRDLKPDNVMLTERGKAKDIVRVLDFGIAKLRDEQNKVSATNPMTRAGDLVGTPQYMSPEQIRGEEVDGRTDVYALGAILYEMVTGRLVFEGPSLMAILSRHLLDTPEPPTRRRPDLALPIALDALVLSMLAKDKGQRLSSMEVANERIAAVSMQVGDHTPPPTWTAPTGVGMPAPTPNTGPGARMMRPPGVPSTYPPGQMMMPPSGAMSPVPSPPPRPMQPMQQPMQPMQQQPMQQPMMQPPMHMMQPRPMPVKRAGTPAWIWIVIGLVAVVAIGVGIGVAVKGDKDGGASSSPELDGVLVAAGPYHVLVPAALRPAPNTFPADSDIETSVYSGSVKDQLVTLVLVYSKEDISNLAQKEYDDGCNAIAQQFFGGQRVDSHPVSGQGTQKYRCTVAGVMQQAEGAIYSGAAGTLVVFYSSPASGYDALASAREEMFDRRVEEPSP